MLLTPTAIFFDHRRKSIMSAFTIRKDVNIEDQIFENWSGSGKLRIILDLLFFYLGHLFRLFILGFDLLILASILPLARLLPLLARRINSILRMWASIALISCPSWWFILHSGCSRSIALNI